jgi:hypothetical protein
MMTGINVYVLFECLLLYTYIFNYILFVGKHPFLNANGTMNHKKQQSGEYEKVRKGRYSPALIDLMERMIDVV